MQHLEKMCNDVKNEIPKIRDELQNTDIEAQKSKVNGFITCFTSTIQKLLEGSVIGDPDKFGLTLSEEKMTSACPDWPVNNLPEFILQNADIKLYGGSQYERLLNEFEFIAHSIGIYIFNFYL